MLDPCFCCGHTALLAALCGPQPELSEGLGCGCLPCLACMDGWPPMALLPHTLARASASTCCPLPPAAAAAAAAVLLRFAPRLPPLCSALLLWMTALQATSRPVHLPSNACWDRLHHAGRTGCAYLPGKAPQAEVRMGQEQGAQREPGAGVRRPAPGTPTGSSCGGSRSQCSSAGSGGGSGGARRAA